MQLQVLPDNDTSVIRGPVIKKTGWPRGQWSGANPTPECFPFSGVPGANYPKTEEGWEELGKRVATAHANYVIEKIERLNCPTWQKLELYQAVIDTAKGIYKPKEHQKPGWHKWRSAPGGWSRRCPRLSSGQWCRWKSNRPAQMGEHSISLRCAPLSADCGG